MLQKILKEEEEKFFSKRARELLSLKGYNDDTIEILKFFQSYNAQIIKAVTEEMTGKLLNPYKEEIQGYNDRIQEEIFKAKELIKESEVEK